MPRPTHPNDTQMRSFILRLSAEFKKVYRLIGNLTSLTTSDKTSIVRAINEVRDHQVVKAPSIPDPITGSWLDIPSLGTQDGTGSANVQAKALASRDVWLRTGLSNTTATATSALDLATANKIRLDNIVDSGDVNTFEYGTWIPYLRQPMSAQNLVPLYESQVGLYYRIGRLLTISFSMEFMGPPLPSPTGEATVAIGGIPYAYKTDSAGRPEWTGTLLLIGDGFQINPSASTCIKSNKAWREGGSGANFIGSRDVIVPMLVQGVEATRLHLDMHFSSNTNHFFGMTGTMTYIIDDVLTPIPQSSDAPQESM